MFGMNYFLEEIVFFFSGSKLGKFSKVSVSGCDEKANACVLKRHSNATIGLDFSLSKL